MTAVHLPERRLQTMPAPIFYSTLQSGTGFIAILFRLVADALEGLLGWLVRLSALALVAWPFMFFAHKPAALFEARLNNTLYLAGIFALCILLHWLELFMAVPWKGLRYPAVLADSRVEPLLSRGRGYSLSLVTAVWALLLWITWYNGWQDWAGKANTLEFAAANTGLAAVMYLYGRFPPYYFFGKPSQSDRQWLRAGGSYPQGTVTDATHARSDHSPEPAAAPPQSAPEYATPVEAVQPRTSFADILGMQGIKKRLIEPARAIVAETTPAEGARNGILLYGAPGNGKTVFAESLAGELGVALVTLTYGDVVSKWIGQTPRQISNCFAYAKANAPCVLFIDEVDSFLRPRDSQVGGPEDLKITNTLLTEIVTLRDHRVVLVAATNYLSCLDPAAIREGRFDFKVEITPPDEPARVGLLRQGARRHAVGLTLDAEALDSVARRWNGFSVSRLLAVARELPAYAREQGSGTIAVDEWIGALRRVQGRKGQVPKNAKTIGELVLDAGTREGLELIASRLKAAHRIEALGGTLPSGVLFHGPSGTGKTAAACALALECGWAFLPVAGPDLLADRERIKRVYAEAADLRPALVFIDEADDILRNRQLSINTDLVNRLLVLMDGAQEKVRDVVIIAATNHPEQVDPALLRAGRFTEKIEFCLPQREHIQLVVRHWLKTKMVQLESGVGATQVSNLLSSQSIASVEGILQYALNRAIACFTEFDDRPIVRRSDIAAGLRVVGTQHLVN